MGDKVAAREIAAKAGVPTVPGSDGRIDAPEEAREVAARLGFPVMIKAAAGGGGRGIRIVNDRAELDRLVPQASAEAKAAFGDGGLYLEKVIERARHIEVQVLGDGRDVVHCFERECSLQRRRQKLWEEAPAANLPDEVRARLCACAVELARAVSYRGAGTLEFLYDEATRDFYFIEMNTRIQVEHPVTEFITGVDLVREMIRIAGGEPLRLASGRYPLRRPCHRMPHQRRRSRQGLHAVPGRRQRPAHSGRPRRALRQHALRGLRGAALLRFAARQIDRLGREPRRRDRATGDAPSANSRSRA